MGKLSNRNISFDIDDDEVITYQTLEKVLDTEEWGNA